MSGAPMTNPLELCINNLDRSMMQFYHYFINKYHHEIVVKKPHLCDKNHVFKVLSKIKGQYDAYLLNYIGRYESKMHFKEKITYLVPIINIFERHNILYVMRYVLELIYDSDPMTVIYYMNIAQEHISSINKLVTEINNLTPIYFTSTS